MLMKEILSSNTSELTHSLEKSKNTALVVLPEVLDGIRLGMHTDTTLNLLKALNELDRDLKIEGRVLTREQENELWNHPIYRFFMQSRMVRVKSEEQAEFVAFATPNDLGLDEDEVSQLIGLTFSPTTLSRALNYHVGFFDARQLVEMWKATGNTDEFLPIFGGTNEFVIGSDTIPEEALGKIAQALAEKIHDQTGMAIGSTPSFTPQMLTSVNCYPIKNIINSYEFISKNDLKKINFESKSINAYRNHDEIFDPKGTRKPETYPLDNSPYTLRPSLEERFGIRDSRTGGKRFDPRTGTYVYDIEESTGSSDLLVKKWGKDYFETTSIQPPANDLFEEIRGQKSLGTGFTLKDLLRAKGLL